MECGHCGARAEPGQRFCGFCGKPLALSCPNCGHENPSDHRFCSACGVSLAASPAPTADRPHSTERRVISVLFIDLVGFTSFSQHRDPEEVRALVTEYFDVAREVIARFGGTIEKFIGDAVMAWWGADVSLEDDAERAVRAALELVDRIGPLGERRGVPDLAARAGVMTGEVAVGPGGNDQGLVIGDLVNTTSRLQSVAAPNTVYVGETTATLIGSAIEVVEAGSHRVKGKDEPVIAFHAIRVLAERGGRGKTGLLEPPFVGRTSELRLLKDSLHSTGRDGWARLVSLIGQAGIGKSRLTWEFEKYVDGLVESVYWHEGRSPAYGDGLALWALGEMIRRRAGIGETDDDETTRSRLAESVAEHLDDPDTGEWVRRRLEGLLGLADSVGVERTELFAAARALFEGIARKGTVVLVFEDLHWADPSLLEFIEELPDWSQNHPILVVTMSRPDLLDRRPDWGSGRRGFASIYLNPLADEEVAELVAGTVPGIPDRAVSRIVSAAGGVPLFAVEMLRMLLSDGRLEVGDDGVRITGDLEHLEVPSTVQAVISSRLDRLPTAERELARDVAVLGHSFTLEGLAALREESQDKLERLLGDLVRHEILELNRDPRSPERGQYQWVQSMLKEVAYGRISRADRHDLHLRVARFFHGKAEPELAPVAASHYLAASEYAAGEEPELDAEVAEALGAAIDRAQALHAHEQLLALVAAALPVVPAEMEADLREIGALAAVRLNDVEAADAHVEALGHLAESSSDDVLGHRAVALFGRVCNDSRRPDRAVGVLDEHIALHPDLDSDPNLARVGVYLARSRLLTGDDVGAASIADEALAAVERFGMLEEVADAMITRGTALSASRLHQSMALLRGALRLCEERGLQATKMRALANIGYASQDIDESTSATVESYEEAKRVGDRSQALFSAGNLLGLYSYRLDFDSMRALLDDPLMADARADRIGLLAHRADLAVNRGDLDEAEELLAEARELAPSVEDPQALLTIERADAQVAAFRLDFRTAFGIGLRHFREVPFAPVVSVAIAVNAAMMEGDVEMLREAKEIASGLPSGTFSDPFPRMADAGLLLAEGDVEGAVARADDLAGVLREQGVRAPEWQLMASMGSHLPAGHEARDRYLARARRIASEQKAPGLDMFLDRLLARSPAV